MPVLVARAHAYCQSWDTFGRLSVIDSGTETSKSGWIGLLLNITGMPRTADDVVEMLSLLEMAVRVDRPGHKEYDFHTAGGGLMDGERYGVPKANGNPGDTVISYRYYLVDAEFIIMMEGPEDILSWLNQSLLSPSRIAYLGRRCCIPGLPIAVSRDLFPGDLDEALTAVPWRSRKYERTPDGPLRVVRDSLEGSNDVRMDVPLTFRHGADIKHGARCVRVEWVEPKNVSEDYRCTFTG